MKISSQNLQDVAQVDEVTKTAVDVKNENLNIKKLENIDLKLAISAIRDGVYYEKGICILENLAMAAFLKDMYITCSFVFGECLYVSKSGRYGVVHRNYNIRDKRFKRMPFHFWLDVDGMVLDISPGSWTHDEHWKRRIEYIYGEYNNGFALKADFDRLFVSKNFNYKANNELILQPNSYSYLKFESDNDAKKAYKNFSKFRGNMTMYEDIKFIKNSRWMLESTAKIYNFLINQ